MKLTIHTQTPDETELLGRTIGSRLRGGEVIELRSDVGGGKTTLTCGIVAGAGSDASVGSPTFTVTKQYPIVGASETGLRAVVHADMYRLQDPGIIRHELADVLDETSALIIEWAESVADVLPDERVIIELRPSHAEQDREIVLSAPDSLRYVLRGIEGDIPK